MTRRYERGSVVGFVLVGILLTAVLVGGVWFARHPAGSSTDTTSDSKTADTNKTASDDRDTTSSTSSTTATATTDEQLKETLAKQAAEAARQKAASSAASAPSVATTSTKLPTTGPADTLLEMLGVAMLSGVTVAYIRSRSIA